MTEEAVAVLNDIMDALRVVLEDPHFQKAPQLATHPVLSAWRFIKNGFRFHDERLVLDNLKKVEEKAPFKINGLLLALRKSVVLHQLRSLRQDRRIYKLATLPLLLPRVASILSLLKFSTREAQSLAYYTVWLFQALALYALVGYFFPLIAPGVLMWCVIAETMDRDLEVEEILGSLGLFSILSMSCKVEYVLDLCQDKGIELGTLIHAAESYGVYRAIAELEPPPESRPRRMRVNLLKGGERKQ